MFDSYLTGLTPEQVTRICAVAVPRATKLTTGQLAVLLRRMVIAVDPEAAARWYRKGIRERNVTAVVAHDGTVVLSANGLPADEAEAACIRLQNLADAAKRAGHPGLIGQIRCDLFLGMLDGRFHHMSTAQVIAALIADYHPTGPAGPGSAAPTGQAGPPTPAEPAGPPTPAGRGGDAGPAERAGPAGASTEATPGPAASAGTGPRPEGSSVPVVAPDATPEPARPDISDDERVGIEIRVGLATLLGRDEHPAEIPGLGLLAASDARCRVGLQGRAEWRFAVTDTEGRLISEGLPGGVPGASVATDPRAGSSSCMSPPRCSMG